MKVWELIQLLRGMDPEKEVVQEVEEWCDVGFSLETYNKVLTRSVVEVRDQVVLKR
jgi:hypothetical protein